MFFRFCFIISTLTVVSGCIVTPRFEMTQRIDFSYTPQASLQVQPMSYNDVLCCYDCQA